MSRIGKIISPVSVLVKIVVVVVVCVVVLAVVVIIAVLGLVVVDVAKPDLPTALTFFL